MSLRYPCTGQVRADGFDAFLEASLGEPRRNLRAFARELCAVLGAAHLTLVNSGSSANLAAAHALAERSPRGRRRALVAGFTFPTTLGALVDAGFEPFVVDTEPDGFSMDPEALRVALAAFGPPGVVCVTHFLGYPAALRALTGLSSGVEAAVLQDACETMAMRVEGRPLPDWADATTYSFYHPHHLSSYGGGAVATRDAALSRVVDSVAHWGRACTCHLDDARLPCEAPPGMDHHFHYVRRGFNLELSELNAAFGRFSLSRHEEDEAARRARFAVLHAALAEHPRLRTWPAPGSGCSPFVFPVALRDGTDARALCDRLARCGVEARSLMGGAIVDQPAFRDLPNDGLARCRALSRASFFVGVHQTLPLEDVREVARILAEEGGR